MPASTELYRALHLVERIGEDAPPRPRPEDEEHAARRIAEWRSQTPFQSDEWFARRCALDRLSPESFAALLVEPGESLAARRAAARLSWVERLESAYARPRAEAPPGERTAFTSIVAPLLAQAWDELGERLRQALERHPAAPFDAAAMPLLYCGLPTRVDWLLSRSVVLEMRVAKLLDQLEGDTPRERFRRFVQGLAAPERAMGFFRDYPVLARLVVETLERWREASAEILERLAEDWEEIRSRFSPDLDPGALTEISLAAGDLHQDGRAVRILRFESGFRLVYKPRSLGVDVRFAELLAWLRQRGAPEIRTPSVLDRGAYGWSEFLAPRPCASHAEAGRFFERQGALLALLHALHANDIHRSNLLAVGEHPVLLDLESLLGADFGQQDAGSFDVLADFEFESSVRRVMLLPYLREVQGGEVVDVSGLGGEGGQPGFQEEPVWENRETDEMRLAWKRPTLDAEGNRPTLGDRGLDPMDFSANILAGFQEMYRLLLRHREELLEEGSPLRALAACEVRGIFRATRLYAMILRESHHPDRLRDALDTEQLFDRLWFGMDRTRFPEVALRLIPSERAALWRGDIPYFTSRGDSRDVRDDRDVILAGLFRRSGLEVVENRLRSFSEPDLVFQTWVIRGSLTALAASGDSVGYRRYPARRPPRKVSRGELLEAAQKVGDRLAEIARLQDGQASWLGLHSVANDRCELRPLDVDLYSGLPGIALFLAWLGHTTGERRHRELAERAWNTVRVRLERRQPAMLGGFDGWGGLLYAAVHLASLWKREDILEEALGWLPGISDLVDEDEQLDLVRGASGCIPPLLSLTAWSGATLPLARRLGDRLVETAQEAEPGLCWDVAASRGRPLLGFSHGASGPAWALLELFGATGEERYRHTALEALRFENSLFSKERGNWPDLRIGKLSAGRTEPMYSATWCHGACGIGLARLLMRRHLPDPWRAHAERDVETAFATTLRSGFGTNHSLCHGDLGALDFLLQAAHARGNGWQAEVERAKQRVVASIEENGWICGVPTAVETPGLMNGLAGIGLGLLRLAEPFAVPSVLALEAPHNAA